MAIKRVSDLPQLTYKNIENNKDRFNNSLLEIEYRQETDGLYTSNCMTISEFRTALLNNNFSNADIAELYLADENLPPGTLVEFGGKFEVTRAKNTVNAVVSTSPAIVLNFETDVIPQGSYLVKLCLTGRIPVLVNGKVKKFDRIILDPKNPGYAKKAKNSSKNIIGICLDENKSNNPISLECVTRLSLEVK